MSDDYAEFSEIEDLPWNLDEAELILIQRALKQTRGNVSKAAELLGVHRMKIYRKLAQGKNTDSEASS